MSGRSTTDLYIGPTCEYRISYRIKSDVGHTLSLQSYNVSASVRYPGLKCVVFASHRQSVAGLESTPVTCCPVFHSHERNSRQPLETHYCIISFCLLMLVFV